MDWGIGEYERTARDLQPAAAIAVDALRPRHGERILDVGCGTGNAALLAARQGALVAGIDESARLIAVAARRANADAVTADWVVGRAEDLPFADDRFAGVVSVFGAVYSSAGRTAAAELVRVCRPGGRVVLTAWSPSGPLAVVGTLLASALGDAAESTDRDGVEWWRPDVLRELFGAATEITEHEIAFTSSSPAAWALEQAEYNPAWRHVRDQIAGDRFEDLLDEITAIVSAANDDPFRLRIMSSYVVARARV